jgi:hypothetical protein
MRNYRLWYESRGMWGGLKHSPGRPEYANAKPPSKK